MQGDLYHSDLESQARTYRNRKRYRILPSPLISCQYWRVLLDESQMMGEGTARCAEMCLLLPAVQRWGVSGTPLVKGLDDLYGLFLFLGIQPYCNHTYWNKCLSESYQQHHPAAVKRLHLIIQRLMWRNSKASISHELSLPTMTQRVHTLQFTPVERYFYNKRQEQCIALNSSLHTRLSQLKRQNQLTSSQLKSLLHSLLRLRQSCDHPQLGQETGFVSLGKHTLTMTEMTQQLWNEARTECEEQQRLMFAAIHGLAALYMIRHQYTEAIQKYQEVLGIRADILGASDEWNSQLNEVRGRGGPRAIAMDTLQEIHACCQYID